MLSDLETIHSMISLSSSCNDLSSNSNNLVILKMFFNLLPSFIQNC